MGPYSLLRFSLALLMLPTATAFLFASSLAGSIRTTTSTFKPPSTMHSLDSSKIPRNGQHGAGYTNDFSAVGSDSQEDSSRQRPSIFSSETDKSRDSSQVGTSSDLSRSCSLPSFVNNTVIHIGCCNVTLTEKIADCANCNLSAVPINLPVDIQTLILAHNNITSEVLEMGPFAKYSRLTHLWLDSNRITYLPDNAFEGLENLLVLNLRYNQIIFDEHFRTCRAFHPLNATLECLFINKNTNDTSENSSLVYPDQALSGLFSLSALYIDGLMAKEFGVGFTGMTSLRYLILSGYREGNCNMVSISNLTFSNLSQIQHLNISQCILNGSRIEMGAFLPLVNLQSLDVTNNFDLGIQAVGNFMYGLRNNQNFRYLKMQRIGPRFAPCIVVYRHTLRYFKSTSLEVIEAMDNEIEMVERGALQMLPSSLRKLNLTNNKIMFGAYWKDMASLTGLQNLHLDGYKHPVRFPEVFPPEDFHCPAVPGVITEDRRSGGEAMNNDNECICGPNMCSNTTEEFILPLPPNLENFTMYSNSMAYIANNVSFCGNNSLRYADLSGNIFKNLIGPISGLDNLMILNLSDCFVEIIGEHFFDNLSSLVQLNLFQNLLGDCLADDKDGKVFDKLSKLQHLNIAFNNLDQLNPTTFRNLENLEILNLSINSLSNVEFDMSKMNKLKHLDLHKNSIRTLPKEVMDNIDQLLKNSSVTIDMRKNPISCDCQNLEFLEWVVRTRVFGTNYTGYICEYHLDHRQEMLQGYDEKVKMLRQECVNNLGRLLYVVGGTLILVLTILGVSMYRFRWTLRYWYHAAKLKVSLNSQSTTEEFEYDVFVSYASEDTNFVLQELTTQLEKERNITLMIHGEKFQVGRHIADNIYMAVRQCRKTLVVVTQHMLKSHWCTYELQMARMENISTGRNVLVFLFLEEVPTSMMSIDVVSYLKTSTYISYPTNPQHRQAFWNKLAYDLRAK